MDEKIPLKEFLELKIAYEAREVIHVKEILSERKIALDLQAKEYERRLEDLNGEAGRLRMMQPTYMPRELSEAKHTEHEKKIGEINNWKSKQEGMQYRAQWIAVAAMGLTIILYFIKK